MIHKLKSLALRLACHWIRGFVVKQMEEAGWSRGEKNPAVWFTPKRQTDAGETRSSVHEVHAAQMLLADILNDSYADKKSNQK